MGAGGDGGTGGTGGLSRAGVDADGYQTMGRGGKPVGAANAGTSTNSGTLGPLGPLRHHSEDGVGTPRAIHPRVGRQAKRRYPSGRSHSTAAATPPANPPANPPAGSQSGAPSTPLPGGDAGAARRGGRRYDSPKSYSERTQEEHQRYLSRRAYAVTQAMNPATNPRMFMSVFFKSGPADTPHRPREGEGQACPRALG